MFISIAAWGKLVAVFMSKSTLKLELSILEKNFPRDHERFQVALASAEELVCKFVAPNGTKYHIQSNISVSISLWLGDFTDDVAVLCRHSQVIQRCYHYGQQTPPTQTQFNLSKNSIRTTKLVRMPLTQ